MIEIIQRVDEAIIEQAKKKFDERKKKNWNHASVAGWVLDCPRYLAALRLCPEKEKESSLEKVLRLHEGRQQESLIRSDLDMAGIERIKVPAMESKEYQLIGEIDDALKLNGNEYPVDYKSCSSNIFRQIRKYEVAGDLLQSRAFWIRHYPAQLQLYNVLYRFKVSYLLFKDKDSGKKHAITVPWDALFTQKILDGLREVNEFVKKEDLPSKTDNEELCYGCGFAESLCYDEPLQKTITQIDKEDLLMNLMRRDEIEVIAKEYKKLDDAIKGEFKETLGEFRIGNFFITNKPFVATVYNVPEEIKKKYAKEEERSRITIKNLGRTL